MVLGGDCNMNIRYYTDGQAHDNKNDGGFGLWDPD